jgi:hypothetical protein
VEGCGSGSSVEYLPRQRMEYLPLQRVEYLPRQRVEYLSRQRMEYLPLQRVEACLHTTICSPTHPRPCCLQRLAGAQHSCWRA